MWGIQKISGRVLALCGAKLLCRKSDTLGACAIAPRFPKGIAMQVSFSPDGRFLVSASFDKSIKLWDGVKGTFLGTFRGHVGPVYQVCWAADSRLIVSGSKDSTLKARPCFQSPLLLLQDKACPLLLRRRRFAPIVELRLCTHMCLASQEERVVHLFSSIEEGRLNAYV